MARVDAEKRPIYGHGDDYRTEYHEIERRSAFHDVVVATAQDWVNPRWKLTEVRQWDKNPHLFIATVFENPRANQKSVDRLDIKKAFRPELYDIFDEHVRYRKRLGIREEKGWLYFTLARMKAEVEGRTSAFNAGVNSINASHQQRDSYRQMNYTQLKDEGLGYGVGHFDTRLLYVTFGFTDLDAKLGNLTTEYERVGRDRFGLQFRVERGIPLSEEGYKD